MYTEENIISNKINSEENSKNTSETNEISTKNNNNFINICKKFKIVKYQCLHGCNHSFKTKRQKILHHFKLDNFCHEEKVNIMKLCQEYNNAIDIIIPDKKEKLKLSRYKKILKQYNYVCEKSLDKAQIESIIQLK